MEITTELDPGDSTLEIPWSSTGNLHLHFIDLKKFPERIETLEECRRHPPLAALLQGINAAGSPFRTAKCDVWITSRLAEEERLDFPVRFKMGSYVDLIFEQSRLNKHVKHFLELGHRLERALHPCHVEAQAEMVIRRCLFHPKEIWGYSATVFSHAYGASRSDAKKEWCKAIECLAEGLAGAGQIYPVRTRKAPEGYRGHRKSM